MITARVNPDAKTLTLEYPAFAKIKTAVVAVKSYDDASCVLRYRTIKFIGNELQHFINMRRYIFNKGNTWTVERVKAIDHLQHVIDSYGQGSLHRLSRHVANSNVSFSTLMPTKPSPARTHFESHIIPIINYCKEINKTQS